MEEDQLSSDKISEIYTNFDEYEIVRKILVCEFQWEISLKNHIRIISINNHDEIIVNFDKLWNIATQYNTKI